MILFDILSIISLITSLILYFTIKEKKILSSMSSSIYILMIIISILYFSVRFHIRNMLLLMILIPGIPPL